MFGDRVGGRWAAGDADVDGEQVVERADELGGVAEDVASERAVAERGDEPRLGHRLVCGVERAGHTRGDGAGDEQDVGVAWGGDDVEAVALEVVEGVGDGAELVLAAVA